MASLPISSSFSQPKLTSHEYHVNERSNKVIFEKDLAKQDEFEPIAYYLVHMRLHPNNNNNRRAVRQRAAEGANH